MTIKEQRRELDDLFATDGLKDASVLTLGLWFDAFMEVYRLVKGERLNEIRGQYIRRFDGQGLHPLSAAVGRAQALQRVCPELPIPGVLELDLALLRREAREDAWEEHHRDFLAKQKLGEFLEQAA